MLTEQSRSGEHLSSLDIEIIGNGNIGDKAEQFVEKTELIRQLGFHTPPRTVLAEGFFDGFIQRNGLGSTLTDVPQDPQVAQVIRRGSFPEMDFRTIERVAGKYNSPLAIRSSAVGDARGTGTYKSDFTEPHPSSVRKTIQRVLGSYFSPEAIAFRRDAQTGEGFAEMIEPLIGTVHGMGEYAPLLSGFGYTSTARGEGYLNIVPGLGGGVDTQGGERVTRTDLEPHEGNLAHYVLTERYNDLSYRQPRKVSRLRQNDYDDWSHGDNFRASIYLDHTQLRGNERVVESSLYFTEEDMQAYQSLNLHPFFDRLQQLEERVGKHQYIEWALTFDHGSPLIWMTQIADIQPRADVFDFGGFGREVFSGASVIGAGIYKTNNVVFCESVIDIESLRKFNEKNEGYTLIYSSNFTSLTGTRKKIQYNDISNALVLIELAHQEHAGHPLSHFGGQLDMTGKLFAIAESRELPEELREDFEVDPETGAFVLKRNITVVGSERQNRLGLFLQE